MNFMFLVVPKNAESYLQEKLVDDPANVEEQEKIGRVIDNARANTGIPEIAAESEFYDLDRKQLKLVDIAKRCAIQSLLEEYPLNPGEEIQDDFFSYLKAPWRDVPASTAVLKRKTNMAEILYFFDSVRIGADGIVHISAPQPEAVPERAPKGISSTVVANFIQKLLAKAGPKIGGAIAEKLGAVVMKLVMKEVFGVDDDPQKIINEVKKIVTEEVESNEVSRVEGTIDGTIQYITVEYYNRKRQLNLKNPDHRKELSQGIMGFSNKFYTDVIGFLRQEKYAERGLKTFAFGSSVHLLLTQELALVDPDEMDPNQSSYLATLRNNAANYKTHVKSVYERAMAARNNFQVFSERTTVDNGNRYITSVQWYWKDHYLNQRYGPYGSSKNPDKTAEQNAREAMEQARTAALAEKRTQLGDPEASFLGVVDGVINFEGFSK
jgi:delta endotoxin-like protein